MLLANFFGTAEADFLKAGYKSKVDDSKCVTIPRNSEFAFTLLNHRKG